MVGSGKRLGMSERRAISGFALVLNEERVHVLRGAMLSSEDGAHAVAFDGYLANWEELQRDLSQRGHRLEAPCDARLVLAAYRQWGEHCVEHCEGEFAFAIRDEARHTVFCARDHIGVRALFHGWRGRDLVIASDIADVVAALDSKLTCNTGYLAEVAADEWYTRDETVWCQINRLPPAHVMTFASGDIAIRRYWQVPVDVTIRHRSDAEYAEHYREVLRDCVRKSARSDRRLAIEVSGGLDSSAIYAMAQELRRCDALPARGLRAYSLRGEAGSEADEIDYARRVVGHWNDALAEAELVLPPLTRFASEASEDRDLPAYPNAMMARGLYAKMASDGCGVVLSGIGGDQWLDGALAYHGDALRGGDWRAMAQALAADRRAEGAGFAMAQLGRQVARALLPLSLRSRLARLVRRPAAAPWSPPAWLAAPAQVALAERRASWLDETAGKAPHYKRAKAEYPYLSTMFETNRRNLSRAGLDYRYPMFSRAFVEFSCATPEHTRLRAGRRKFIHRRALADLLPPEVLERRGKADFSIAFTRLASDISRTLAGEAPQGVEEVLDLTAVRPLLHCSEDTQIDRIPPWQVWGIYGNWLCATMQDTGRSNGVCNVGSEKAL